MFGQANGTLKIFELLPWLPWKHTGGENKKLASTTIYKAGLSTLEDWEKLITKIITKYAVLTT